MSKCDETPNQYREGGSIIVLRALGTLETKPAQRRGKYIMNCECCCGRMSKLCQHQNDHAHGNLLKQYKEEGENKMTRRWKDLGDQASAGKGKCIVPRALGSICEYFWGKDE